MFGGGGGEKDIPRIPLPYVETRLLVLEINTDDF